MPSPHTVRVNLAERSYDIKARIIEQDEHETTGERAMLNFGYTIGYTIETSASYGELFHGEAIALGMIAAARISIQVPGLAPTAASRLTHLLKLFNLPTKLHENISDDAIRFHLKHDKKFSEDKIRFVVLRSLGDAFVSGDVTNEHIVDAINSLRH